jgi:Uma2 family endonuclease
MMTLFRRAHLPSGYANPATPEGESVHLMALETKRWTLDELHSLPEDGNKYELVNGELFVTPAPRPKHEAVLARLSAVLQPYVAANALDRVYHPRSVIQLHGSEVEPDLMVRPELPRDLTDWSKAPPPILVVETTSEYTRRRDYIQKRQFYTDAAIPESWIVDPDERPILVVTPGSEDQVIAQRLTWSPPDSREPLVISLREIFGS